MRKASHRRPPFTKFHLNEKSKIGKSIQTVYLQLPVARTLEGKEKRPPVEMDRLSSALAVICPSVTVAVLVGMKSDLSGSHEHVPGG